MRTGLSVGRRLLGGALVGSIVLVLGSQVAAAPPRSIADITAVLDRYKPDAAKLAALQAKAATQPLAGANDQQLADFFFDRAQAATELGRRDQSVADARQSVALGKRGNHPNLNRFMQLLANVEEDAGNLRQAADLNRERIRISRNPGQVITSHAALANTQFRMGSFGEAERSLRTAESEIERARNTPNADLRANLELFKLNITGTRLSIAVGSGNIAGVEPQVRTLIRQLDDARKSPEVQRLRQAAQVQEDIYDRMYLRSLERLTSLLVRAGRLTEAETEARRMLNETLSVYGRYSTIGASAILALTDVIYEQGRYSDAQTLTDIAIDAFRQSGAGEGSVQLARALVLRGRIQAQANDPAGALATFESARALFPGDEALRRRYVDDIPAYAETLLATGRADAAVPLLQRVAAERQRQFGERNILTAEARAYYAVAMAKSGQSRGGFDQFRESMQIVLQASRQTEDETSGADRERRLRQISETFMELLIASPPPGGGRPPAMQGGQQGGGFGQPGNRPQGQPPGNRDVTLATLFRLTDSQRARGVQRALNASALRSGTGNAEQADLIRREQDAQKQISAQLGVLAEILASPSEQQDAETVQALRVAIDKLRDERAALRQQLEQRFPNYTNLISPRPADPADIQALLQPNEVLLSIYVGHEKTVVIALRREGPVQAEMVDLGEKEIAERVTHLRQALDPNAATLDDVPAFDVAAAHDLYARLIGPVAAALRGADTLIVVPDKALGQLPFGLLVTAPVAPPGKDATSFAEYRNVPFLIRQMAVSQLPTTSSLRTLRAAPRGAATRRAFAGFGDPWFNPEQAREGQAQMAQAGSLQTRGRALVRRNAPTTLTMNEAGIGTLPRLPETADEVRAIGTALRADLAADVFLGTRASEQTVKTTDLTSRKVVMFATHGLIPGDLDGLDQPALAMSAPGVVPGDEDGLLTMEEILALRLDADWVVLSACNTGAADGAGAEAASGLGRAFFYAGTRAVLLTNWPVETNSARDLTTDLFRRQADDPNLSRAKAMQQAMLGLIDGPGYAEGGRTVFSYAHPIFWAPFSVIGDGGV